MNSPALINLISQLADNKLFLGRRYAEWCTGAPTLESAVAAASMAQDEIGHARSFYPLLQDLVRTPVETEPENRTKFTNVPLLTTPFASWTDFVAANLLLDTALTVLLESACHSTVSALGQRARRIVEEEPLHWLHAVGWTRRLSAVGPGVKQALAESLVCTASHCDQIFGAAVDGLAELGVLDSAAPTLVVRFQERIRPILDSAGLSTR